MKIIQEDKKNIKEIISALKKGAVLVLPTDTVYGLVCDACNENSVEKIFQIKSRGKDKPLPVFVKDIKMAKKFAVIDKNQEDIFKKSWPGGVTFILKALSTKTLKPALAGLVYKNETIAMRVPNYGLIKKIFKSFKKPLAQTSANISSQPATIKINEILMQFEKRHIQPDIIIDAGDLPENKPSTIIDLTRNKTKIIRK